MPNAGPRPTRLQVEKFIEYMEGKNIVRSAKVVRGDVVRVTRTIGKSHDIRLVEIYTVGESDVSELLSEDDAVDAIVTASAWNSCTQAAKVYGKQRGVTVAGWQDFMSIYHRL